MVILVTGGAGYIGSHTVTRLLKADHEVVIIDDLSTGCREAVHNKAKFYQGSILDSAFLDKIFSVHRIDAVIHFAAKLVVPESFQFPLLYYETNVAGTLNLLKTCEKFSVNFFIFSSTAAVYGALEENSLTEDLDCKPMSVYGDTKLAAENLIKSFSESQPSFKYIILRYFNVAGAELDGSNGCRSKAATHLIKMVSEAASGKKSCVEIFGNQYSTPDGTGVRDYIHVVDLANAHIAALEYLEKTGVPGVFNCGYGSGYSVMQVVESMRKISGVNFKTVIRPPRLGDLGSVTANNQKILSAFNWTPELNNIDVICKSALDWEKNT